MFSQLSTQIKSYLDGSCSLNDLETWLLVNMHLFVWSLVGSVVMTFAAAQLFNQAEIGRAHV